MSEKWSFKFVVVVVVVVDDLFSGGSKAFLTLVFPLNL
jgi:lipoate synthase